MDVTIPTSLLWDTGGALAAQWGECNRNRETFEEIVKPHVNRAFDADRQVTVYLPPGKSSPDDPPHIYVVGSKPGQYEVTESNIRESWKTPGSRKSFERAKKSGTIVLKPMLNCTVKTLGQPSLFSAKPPKIYKRPLSFRRYGQNRHNGGICPNTGVFRSFPALGVDSMANSSNYSRSDLTDVTAVRVDESLLRNASLQVKAALDTIPPNKGLVTQVVSQANSATWDIATELAEMPSTIGYILDRLKGGINTLLRAKRDLKRSIGGSLPHDAASIWMEYRYALMPIIHGVNDALDVLGMDAIKFQSFRGRLDEDLPDITLSGWRTVTKPRVENRVFLKYKYDVDSKIHHGLKINLAATAWELVPLSFVFDWFFQVGDYLTASFRPGVVSSHGCQQSVKCQGQYTLEDDNFGRIIMNIDYYRVRIINPDSYIGINSDVFFSFKRSMDALALSWLLFKRDGRRG